MRTTLSIDDDVAALLKKEMRRSGASLKQVVNHFLRRGLTTPYREDSKPFVVVPRAMGLPAGLSYDSTEDLIEAVEGATHF